MRGVRERGSSVERERERERETRAGPRVPFKALQVLAAVPVRVGRRVPWPPSKCLSCYYYYGYFHDGVGTNMFIEQICTSST